MRQKEKGFTYPFVLMIVILFSLFFTLQLQFYLSEKRLFHESKTILIQEYYMHTAVKKIEASLQSNSLSIGTGEYLFHNGSANYRIETYSSSLLKTTVTIKLDTMEEIVGFVYYDKNQKKMIKWVERN